MALAQTLEKKAAKSWIIVDFTNNIYTKIIVELHT